LGEKKVFGRRRPVPTGAMREMAIGASHEKKKEEKKKRKVGDEPIRNFVLLPKKKGRKLGKKKGGTNGDRPPRSVRPTKMGYWNRDQTPKRPKGNGKPGGSVPGGPVGEILSKGTGSEKGGG